MAKGGDFERDVSKFLSLWWTHNEREDIFWRTSASGARATTRAAGFKKTKYEHGDITFTDPIAKPMLDLMIIEAKRGYTNTSQRIKAADMEKVCEFASTAIYTNKQIKSRIQSLFSKTKRSGGLDLLDLIDSKASPEKIILNQWIARGEVDRAQAGVPYFILIGRRDSRESFVLLPDDLQSRFEQHQHKFIKACRIMINTDFSGDRYFITNCEAYFKWLTPETVRAVSAEKPYRRFA